DRQSLRDQCRIPRIHRRWRLPRSRAVAVGRLGSRPARRLVASALLGRCAGNELRFGRTPGARSGRSGLPRGFFRSRRLRALGGRALADGVRMGSDGARYSHRGQFRRFRRVASLARTRGSRASAADVRRRVGMHVQSLRRRSGISACIRCARRIQRQVHVRAMGAARRFVRDAGRTRARELPQFLLSGGALAVQRHPPGEGRMKSNPLRAYRLDDHQPGEGLLADALAGLSASPKKLSSKYFYDARGSALFERICEQPEYYPTRVELSIMREHVGAIAAALGPDVRLVEYGSGSGLKTRLLLRNLVSPVAYVPVEISRSALAESVGELEREFPRIEMLQVCADFTRPIKLPRAARAPRPTVVYFPGSTLGNFGSDDALRLLRQMRDEA